MDQVARGYEAASSHSQDQTNVPRHNASLNVQDDLSTRIRSLLASRNHQHPSRTPLPTPDYTLIPQGFDENTSGYHPTDPTRFAFSSAKSLERLAAGSLEDTCAFGKYFDGPNSEAETPATDSVCRDSDALGLIASRGRSLVPRVMPVLDQILFGNTTGRDRRKSTDRVGVGPTKVPVPTKSQGHSQAHGPRFLLRTVLPVNPQLTEARLRPAIHHVPGSYRSEIDHNVDTGIDLPMQSSAVVGVSTKDFAIFGNQSTAKAAADPQPPESTAVSEKDRIETTEPDHASRHSINSTTPPTPPRKSSLRTIRSIASPTPYRRHRLVLSSEEAFNTSEQVPPLLTSGLDDYHDRDDEQPLLRSVPDFDQPDDNQQMETPVEGQPPASASVSLETAEGPGLDDLLSQLPSLKESTIDDFKGYALTAAVEPGHPEVPLPAEPWFGHEDELSDRRGSSEDSAVCSPHIAVSQPIERRNPSNHSRASSRLSSMSSESASQTISSKEYVSDNSLNDVTRLIKLPSPLSTSNRVTIGYAPKAARRTEAGRLHKPDKAAGSGVSGRTAYEDGRQPKSQNNWIRHFLARASDKATPQDLPHLTARPSHRSRRAGTEPVDRSHVNFIPIGKEEPPVNNGGSLQANEKTNTRSTPDGVSSKQMTPETFGKAILDLETLLDDALSVARNVADQEDNEALPAILEEASRMHKNEAHIVGGSSDESASSSDSEASIWHSGPGSDSPSQHNNHVVIIEPDDEDLHADHFKKVRDGTPYPSSPAAASRRVSIMPGDAAPQAIPLYTLYGSQSQPPIQEQLPVQSAMLELVDKSPSNEFTSAPGFRRISIKSPTPPRSYDQTDWAYVPAHNDPMSTLPVSQSLLPTQPHSVQGPSREETSQIIRDNRRLSHVPSSQAVHNHSMLHNRTPIQPRISSAGLRSRTHPANEAATMSATCSMYGNGGPDSGFQSPGLNSLSSRHQSSQGRPSGLSGPDRQDTIIPLRSPQQQGRYSSLGHEMSARQNGFTLHKRSHHSLREHHGFSLSRSHRRAPIARDWHTARKRYVAAIACISTALIGLIVGIYAGEVPAIQYTLADEHHYAILGNVFLYIGLAITTFVFWPLPLLHGRKPYTLIALALLLPLQFPQALVLSSPRSPYLARYRVGLLLSRALSGLVMGFANINFKTTLLDVFGSSLQSSNPHQEVVNEHDVRRHGGGMGLWLGIWTWCFMGSIGVGFLIGALIIGGLTVDWGFYITITLIALVLFLNVLTPEVRRSPYRRSVAEVRTGTDLSRRVARGEVMMHLKSTGPVWWWEEVFAGQVLCARMLKQPGFVVLSLYLGWIYGQIVMIIVLLGALISKYYRFRPGHVGLCVFAVPLGALLAIPFQKASLFSRSRKHPPRTDSMTFQKRVTWTSHLLRRIIFMIVLPFADLAYTLASSGPPVHFMVPTVFAGLIGFLSNLAIAECNGIIMETYDTSDLQPGMTGKPRDDVPDSVVKKRTNYSCYPRVTAGCSISQTFAFLIAAVATGVGGAIERRLGAQTATAVVAAILLILTILLIGVLWRFKEVQVVPTDRFGTGLSLSGEERWRPVIIGNPSGRTRRMSLLELGKMSRWSEIRRKNKLTWRE